MKKNNFNFSKLSSIIVTLLLIIFLTVTVLVACSKKEDKKENKEDKKSEILLPQTKYEKENENLIPNGNFYTQNEKKLKADKWSSRTDKDFFAGLISLDNEFFNKYKDKFQNIKNPGKYVNAKDDRVMLLSNKKNKDKNAYASFYTANSFELGKNYYYKINFVYYLTNKNSSTKANAKIKINDYEFNISLSEENKWAVASLYIKTSNISTIDNIKVSLYGIGSLFVDSIYQETIEEAEFNTIEKTLKYDFNNPDPEFNKYKENGNKRTTEATQYTKNNTFNNFAEKLNKNEKKVGYGIYSLSDKDKDKEYYISKIIDSNFDDIKEKLLAKNEIEEENYTVNDVFAMFQKSKKEGKKYNSGSYYAPLNNTYFIAKNEKVTFSVFVKTNNFENLENKSPISVYAVKYTDSQKNKKTIQNDDIIYSTKITKNDEWTKVSVTIKNTNKHFSLPVVLLLNYSVLDDKEFTYVLYSNLKVEKNAPDSPGDATKEIDIFKKFKIDNEKTINNFKNTTNYLEADLSENSIIEKKDNKNIIKFPEDKKSKISIYGQNSFEIKSGEYKLIEVLIDSTKIKNGEFEFKLIKKDSNDLYKIDEKKTKITLNNKNKSYDSLTNNFVKYLFYVYNESPHTCNLTYEINFGKGTRFEPESLAEGSVSFSDPKMFDIENGDTFRDMVFAKTISYGKKTFIADSIVQNKFTIENTQTDSNLVNNGDFYKNDDEKTNNINGLSHDENANKLNQPSNWNFSKIEKFKEYNSNFEKLKLEKDGDDEKKKLKDADDSWDSNAEVQLINDKNSLINSLDEEIKKQLKNLLKNKKVAVLKEAGDYIKLNENNLIKLNSSSIYEITFETIALEDAKLKIENYGKTVEIKKQNTSKLKIVENKIYLNTIVTNPKQLNFELKLEKNGLVFIKSIKVKTLSKEKDFNDAEESDTLTKIDTKQNIKSGLIRLIEDSEKEGIDNKDINKALVVEPQESSDLNYPIYYQSKKIVLKPYSNYQLTFYYKGKKPSVSLIDITNEKNKIVLPVEGLEDNEGDFKSITINIKTGIDEKSILLNFGLGDFNLDGNKLEKSIVSGSKVTFANIMLYETKQNDLKTIDFTDDNFSIAQNKDKNGKINTNWTFNGSSKDVHGVFDLSKDEDINKIKNYKNISDENKNELKKLKNPIVVSNESDYSSKYQRNTFKLTKKQGKYFLVTIKVFTTNADSTIASLSVSGSKNNLKLNNFKENKLHEYKMLLKLDDKEANIIFNIELNKKGILIFNSFKVDVITSQQYNNEIENKTANLTINNEKQNIENSKTESEKEKNKKYEKEQTRKMIWIYASSIIISIALISIIIILIFKKSLFKRKKNPYKKKNKK